MKRLGLIIGVNHYQDNTFDSLQFAENDAKALAQWLVNTKGGKWSPPDVQLVQGTHATRELIESQLSQLCTMVAEPEDTVVFYFAGHAFVDERSGDGYLALANTRYSDPTSGLSLRMIVQQIMARSRASHILCILDCFQSGQVWRMRRTSPYDTKPLLGSSVLNALQNQKNRLFLSSCRGNESAPESGERQLGAFVHRAIVGLCGPASESSSGNITLPRLHAYLFRTLDEQHRPQLFGQQQPPLVLIGNPSPGSNNQTAMTTPSKVEPTQTGRQTGNFLNVRGAMSQVAVATAPPVAQVHSAPLVPPASPGPSTSGNLLTSAIEEHRQQQSQQLLAQAQQFLQMQNFGAAFDLVEKALQINPNDSEALVLKGQLLGTAGRFPEALVIIEQILQQEPQNALVWSMQAVALSNMSQHQAAIAAIERSLELDSQNPESYGIKTTIMANMAAEQVQTGNSTFASSLRAEEPPVRENARSFFIGVGMHLLGLVFGAAGCGLLFLKSVPGPAGLILASLGLAILCVSATRGAYRHGFARLLFPLLTLLAIGGGLAAAYQIAFERIMGRLSAQPDTFLLPTLFSVTWLVLAAGLPFILAIFGLIGGLIARARKRA